VSTWTALDDRLFETEGELAPGVPLALVASKCDDCGRYEFPVHDVCPDCHGTTSPARLSPTGTVGQWTAVNHPVPGGLIEVPYFVVAADFPEGISVLGIVTKDGHPGEVNLGDQVEVVATQVGEQIGYAYRIV
jgi:uncharacterized OB-fold protein